jgi:hypothetical protein
MHRYETSVWRFISDLMIHAFRPSRRFPSCISCSLFRDTLCFEVNAPSSFHIDLLLCPHSVSSLVCSTIPWLFHVVLRHILGIGLGAAVQYSRNHSSGTVKAIALRYRITAISNTSRDRNAKGTSKSAVVSSRMKSESSQNTEDTAQAHVSFLFPKHVTTTPFI